MKFDVIIGNPPYVKNLHLKFLEKCYNMSDKIVFIHPAGWMVSNFENSNYRKYKNLIKDDLKSVDLVHGNYIFNAQFFVPLTITNIDKSYSGDIKVNNEIYHSLSTSVSNIDDIFLIHDMNNKHFNSIIDKIDSYDDLELTDGNYYTPISTIIGHVDAEGKNKFNLYKEDFYNYCILSVESKTTKTKNKFNYGFETKIESDNFIKVLDSKLMKIALSYYKIDQHINEYHLWALSDLDYTISWSDEELYKEFNLTEEEIEYIENWYKLWSTN